MAFLAYQGRSSMLVVPWGQVHTISNHSALTRSVNQMRLRDHSVYVPSQWETTLQCNVVSHWLGTYTEWTLETAVSSGWLTEFIGNIPIHLQYLSFLNAEIVKEIDILHYLSIRTNSLILHSQYHGCWWPGDGRSQGITSHNIDLIVLEYYGFTTRRINQKSICAYECIKACLLLTVSFHVDFNMPLPSFNMISKSYIPTLKTNDFLRQFSSCKWTYQFFSSGFTALDIHHTSIVSILC